MPFVPNLAAASFTDQARPGATDLDVLVAAHAQYGVKTGCAVTAQGTPDMTVAVASGTIYAAGVEVAVSSGNVTITAAHSTLPRKDIIVVSNAGVKSCTAGTAAATPVAAAIPATSVVLAEVYVPAADTAIGSTQIIDKRIVLTVPISVGAWTLVSKTADESLQNNTLQNDDHLKFTMAINTRYRIRGRMFYTTGTTPDFKWGFTGPAAPTLIHFVGGEVAPNTSTWTLTLVVHSAYDTTGRNIISSSGTEGYITLDGVVENGANTGDFQMMWSQATTTATNTTVRKGSYLEYLAV